MWCTLLICLSAALVDGQTQDDYNYILETTTAAILAHGEKKMSELVLDTLKHFQGPDPVGVPGADIPDPMVVPDRRQPIGFSTLIFKDTKVYGMSKFRILHVNAEIASMKVAANMSYDDLEARGSCVANSFWNSVQSPFSIKLSGTHVTGLASLGISRDGRLFAQDIAMEIYYKTVSVNFESGGPMGFIISSFVNSAGNFLFDTIKPYVLEETYTKAKEDINRKLDDVVGDLQFPNTISPLDMLIIDVRKKIRALQLDPYKIEDYNSSVSMFSVALCNTYIKGVSSFKRIGNISVTFDNNTIIADFAIGTEELEGTTEWEISAINGILTKAGTLSFSVKYINGRIILAQPVDTRKRSELKKLVLDVGNLQIRSDGAGTLDFMIEGVVNILPNLLRYQIINTLENPIKWRIQKELDEFDVEEAIKEKLPIIDEFQEKGFKLSELREIQEDTDEDDFFHF